MDERVLNKNCFQIVPNKFILLKRMPKNKSELKSMAKVPLTAYSFALKRTEKRIRNRINKINLRYKKLRNDI